MNPPKDKLLSFHELSFQRVDFFWVKRDDFFQG